MASRYTSAPKFDYCLSPIHVLDVGKDLYVPCGKCSGCLLHKANVWSMRVGCEIEETPHSIFFTLTYSNKYLPVLKENGRFTRPDGTIIVRYTAHHPDNIRFNGVRDVLRDDDIQDFSIAYEDIPITNYDKTFPARLSASYIAYSSKRDVQLWLKMVRKDLNTYFNGNQQYTTFRYFIISEYGETKFRPHIHGVIFPSYPEQAAYLLQYSLYKNWQMCAENLFYDYAHYCDSGVRGYITQYLTCFSQLPKLYRQVKEVRPFRLSSKAPAVGYILQDKEKIFQDVSIGVIQYTKTISRIGVSSVLRYPSDFMRSCFPKCYQFSQLDFNGILAVYGCIWQAYRRRDDWSSYGVSFDSLLVGFRENLHPMNYNASLRCFRTCLDYGMTPFHYCFLLDMFYYESDISNLNAWYTFQQSNSAMVCLATYSSSLYLFRSKNELAFSYFIEGFGLDVDYWLNADLKELEQLILDARFVFHQQYASDVDDILKDMVKLPKFNENNGLSPVNQFK